MTILEEIAKRFEELIGDGRAWAGRLKRDGYYLDDGAYGWLAAAANLVNTVTSGRGAYSDQVQAILAHPTLVDGTSKGLVLSMIGLLEALQVDWSKGLVRQIEYLISAETFDAFLDHAENYHKGNHHRESGVLVSIVFEDSVRKLAKKYGLDSDADVEVLIDEFVKTEVITPVRARRLKGGPAALRNKALHAKWSEFDLKDVGEAMKTTREFLELL